MMNRFTRKLVINYTGVIFLSFLIVYFLFNALASNYIRGIAEGELATGMVNAVTFTDAVFVTGTFPQDMALRTHEFQFTPFTDAEQMFMFVTQYAPMLRFGALPQHIPPSLRVGNEPLDFEVSVGIFEQDRIFTATPGYNYFQPTFSMGSITPRAAIVDTSVIIIDETGEIISPNMVFLPPAQHAQIALIADYYRANTPRFNTHEMRRVRGNGSTYYVSTLRRPMPEGEWSFLMYTDITSAMNFTRRMNQILGVLLVVSGLAGLAITLSLSSRFKQSIARLCGYAETIGHGNFDTPAGTFKDEEFSQLSQSMDAMAHMLQAYETKQKQFFQNASHELRTPLMSIQGFAEGLMDGVFDTKEGAGIILAEGHKMAALVDELLYVSRMDSQAQLQSNCRKTQDITQEINLPELLRECQDRLQPIANSANKKMTLVTDFEEIQSAPKIILHANYEKLERALTNILTNAIRHAHNEVTLHCATDARQVKITIADDGNGINPNDAPHIFERFYKGENGNVGLGLAISKDIIKSLGGTITAKNNENSATGAVFVVILPFRLSA
ncbi:MAG: HAMP domain-containing histidine kinase [Defluviitaleaceae bacterium]|nr:HAMP domain-containing histidine kinase [Defluviitaleaceae bacterium]MCL2274505.1 HAMP domain-containing histidine kinase [Defluviitaleaceae bacterium]